MALAPSTSVGGIGTTPVAGVVQLTAGDISTASTSFVDLTGATITMTTGAARVLLTVSGSWFISAAGSLFATLLVDGVNQGGTNGLTMSTQTVVNKEFNASFSFLTGVLTAASHTFKVQWRVDSNTGTMHASAAQPLSFSALETGAIA